MNWIVIGLSAGLLIWMLYQEWTRPNKSWLAARLIASVVAVLSLLFIALPIYYRYKISVTENEAILLTEGWNQDSLNRYKGLPVFTDPYLTNQRLHVFGYGLNEYELRRLKYKFHPSSLRNTIDEIEWNQSISLGRPLQVRGSYINSSNQGVKIVLSAFSLHLDSATVSANQTSSFHLSTVPKQIGRAVFTISVLKGKDTIESNPVPVEITSPQPLRLLMLSSAPDFEKKFLKNWLSGHHFPLSIKTKISSGKWDQESLNHPPTSWKEFDIVLADVNALAALSSPEISSLRESINSGAGLLVQVDSSMQSSAFYSRPFSLTNTQDSLAHTLQLNLPGEPTLTTEFPLFIRPNELLQTNIRDQHGRILSATSLFGAGRVLATTINNSFVWQLSGQSENYNSYWWHLLTAIAPASKDKSWQLNTGMPRKNEPAGIRFQLIDSIPSLQVGETMLYPARDYFLPDKVNTRFWPRRSGWHPVLRNSQPEGWFYVYEPKDWTGVKRAERLRQTKWNEKALPVETTREISGSREIASVYFFLLFLFSASFLWYEKKRHRA